MLTYDLIDEHQHKAIDYLFEHDVSYLVATMGFGKSVVALTAIRELLDHETVKRVLIVAPLRACNDVWSHEHDKWQHLQGLNVAHAIGSPVKRSNAIESDAQIVVINIDNLVWFLDKYKGLKMAEFDGLVIDEISKFKSSSTRLVKKLRGCVHAFKWVVGMTGTPVHENFVGLYSQLLCLDGGFSFGKNKEKFLRQFFYPTDFDERNWELRDGMESKLLERIKWCVHVTPDYTHTLPPLMETVIGFDLDTEVIEGYKKFARHSITEIEGVEIVAENAAVLSGKLGQFASGFLYYEDGIAWGDVHASRVVAFEKLLTSVDRAIVCYWYKAELYNVKLALDALGCNYMSVTDKGAIDLWNSGQLDYLLLHPASAGHGLNLAAGGSDIIFYSPIWSNDVFKQTVARLWRRGQRNAVTAWILCASGTIDLLKIQRIEDKADYNRLFLEHVNAL